MVSNRGVRQGEIIRIAQMDIIRDIRLSPDTTRFAPQYHVRFLRIAVQRD